VLIQQLGCVVRHGTPQLGALGQQHDPHGKENSHQGENSTSLTMLYIFIRRFRRNFSKSKNIGGLFMRDLLEAFGLYAGLDEHSSLASAVLTVNT
jgi:hypothetical protein